MRLSVYPGYIINLLEKPARHEKTSRDIISKRIWLLSLKKVTWKQRREVLASEKGLQFIKVITLSVTNLFLASQYTYSVYNSKSLKIQTYTEQEFPKYQVEQNTAYQIDWLKREIDKKLFAKAAFLVDETLCCPHVKLSYSQIN